MYICDAGVQEISRLSGFSCIVCCHVWIECNQIVVFVPLEVKSSFSNMAPSKSHSMKSFTAVKWRCPGTLSINLIYMYIVPLLGWLDDCLVNNTKSNKLWAPVREKYSILSKSAVQDKSVSSLLRVAHDFNPSISLIDNDCLSWHIKHFQHLHPSCLKYQSCLCGINIKAMHTIQVFRV